MDGSCQYIVKIAADKPQSVVLQFWELAVGLTAPHHKEKRVMKQFT
jgi:hypothetical protein